MHIICVRMTYVHISFWVLCTCVVYTYIYIHINIYFVAVGRTPPHWNHMVRPFEVLMHYPNTTSMIMIGKHMLPETNSKFVPENRQTLPQKGKAIVFQTSIFRCKLLVSGRVIKWLEHTSLKSLQNSLAKKIHIIMSVSNMYIYIYIIWPNGIIFHHLGFPWNSRGPGIPFQISTTIWGSYPASGVGVFRPQIHRSCKNHQTCSVKSY